MVNDSLVDELSGDVDKATIESIANEIEEYFPFQICGDCDSFVEQEDQCPNCGSSKLVGSFRDHQKEILVESAIALFVDDYDNVVIEGPTGIGKSAINYVLGMMSESAFYTTPQKSLRNQLQDDDALEYGMHALRGRADYTCGATGKDCDACPINKSNEKSCKDEPGCTYWGEKMETIGSQIAAITFAYLIVDKYLPPVSDSGDRISFSDRDLLIVDECHTLEEQVAGMFAGFSVSPWVVPPEVYGDTGRKLEKRIQHGEELNHYKDIQKDLDEVAKRAKRFVQENEGNNSMEEVVDDCESFLQKYNYYREEIKEGREWVVDIDETSHPKRGGDVKTMKLKPVKVDRFLQKFVWSRADKVVLSTATMPYRENPEKWFDRLGLEGETKVIRKPMPFPVENRPIHTGTIIDKFSSGGDEENWAKILSTIQELAKKHDGEKGLIHTASYRRAQKLVDTLPTGMAMADEKGVDSDEMIEKWQQSNAQILCSPSMMEGVDLKYDKARWQVLLKVPYPNSHDDSRVEYLLDKGQWGWYFETTGLQVFQSYGRAVRAPDDEAKFYVLDKSFMDIIERTQPPKWVVEALTT